MKSARAAQRYGFPWQRAGRLDTLSLTILHRAARFSMASAAAPLLRMEGITKSFPGVRALRGVSLELYPGEVLALLGENGAGKSTLIKVLGGAHRPDAGTITIAGRPAAITDPVAAQRLGIAIIYQEFNLVPWLSAAANLFLGQEHARLGFVRRRQERRRARELFERLGVAIDPETPCAELSVAQQQVVEIAKALAADARILIMDEPSAALTGQEVARLFEIIRDLTARGIGIIYISHRLAEVFAIASRVTVLRDGEHVATRPVREVTTDGLIELMVGRKLESEFPSRQVVIGPERLVVRGLRRGEAVRDVSFAVQRGEVLGLTGLVGAGRTETARLLFGADRADGGTVELDGRSLRLRSPRDAIRQGICLLTEDRQAKGLILGRSVRENFSLASLPQLSLAGFVRGRREQERLAGYVRSLRIKLARPEELARNLSGGNQQKVVLARWLETHSSVLIFDEPTRGIDVGAKYEIYQLINELAGQGKAVLLISSELPEVLGMADRILVMHAGRISGEIRDVANATQEQILRLAVGR
jgi:ABC-type sugar transport system ATPase subunit